MEKTATPAEKEELMRLVASGDYNDMVKDYIEAGLSTEGEGEEMSMERAQAILSTIIEKKEARVVPLNPWRWARLPKHRVGMVAAAVVLFAISAIVYLYVPLTGTNNQQLATDNQPLQPAVFTGKQFVHLPDGSTVILNEGSELSYSASFGETVREVTLTGEGYFDIAHNAEKPFKVLTGEITTTVLGTAFNVKAYPGQGEVKVTVTRGKVQVADAERTLGTLTPDQQIAVNTVTNDFLLTSTKAEMATTWKSKYLILDDVSMETAAAIIEEKYNIKLLFDNDQVKSCRITATFLNGEDINQIITVVTGVIGMEYSIQPDGNIKLEGQGCE